MRRFAVISIVVATCVVASSLWWSMRSDVHEDVVTADLTLTDAWQVLHPVRPLRCWGRWSELLLDLRDVRIDATSGDTVRSDGTPVRIESYLRTTSGDKVGLNESEVVGYNGKMLLRLSASELKSTACSDSFATVTIRSDRPIRIGTVVWMSYDPSKHKDGVAFPHSLR